jgi:glycosyltransferase involved in cell wall biosynthesis
MEKTRRQGFASGFLNRDWLFLHLIPAPGMITIFTPSFADEADTNAQNLSVKEIVARLDPERAAVTMLHEGVVDSRIASRPNTTLLRWHKHGNTLRTAWQILRRVPDVYFFPREGPLDAVFLGMRQHLRLRTALVTYIVSGGLYSQGYAPARIRNIHEADVVIANNDYLGLLLKEKFGVDSQTIYDGIDRRYFPPPEPTRASRDSVTVLFAGSLRPYKRAPLVVRQGAQWPEVRFHIAGVGEEERLCKNLAAELKCGNVEFLGHLSQSQLADEMRCADIFFFPSVVEGQPQVLLQAAASGLPAIAMEIYRPDSIVHGTTGFLAANDHELAEKLDLLIRQPELRHRMGEAAVAHARKFDWDQIAGQWLTVFEQAAAQRRTS